MDLSSLDLDKIFFQALLISAAFTFAVMFASIAVGLLTPGRKGKMRTRKQVVHDNTTVEDARNLYAARLQYDKFKILPVPDAAVLRAARGKMSTVILPFTPNSHSIKPIEVALRFEPAGTGVAVSIELWMNDFVFKDTGEGRYVDEALARILGADLGKDSLPIVPNPSMNASVAMTESLLLIVAPALMLLPGLSLRAGTTILVVIFSSAFIAFGLGCYASVETYLKPGEITGRLAGGLGVVLSLFAATIGLVVWALQFGR